MPQAITSIEDLQSYLSRVTARTAHHAQAIGEIVVAIAGAVVLYKDPGTDLTVLTRDGTTGNVLWLYIRGERYAISYNHVDAMVEVRERNTQGGTLISFNNASSPGDVIQFFAGLRDGATA